MSFASPWWLLGLLLIPIVWWIHRRGTGAVSLRQRRAATIVRTVLIVAVVGSLAGTTMSLPDSTVATVFVLDASDSISGDARGQQQRFLGEALNSKPSDALAAVVAFGKEARVETSLQQAPEQGPLATLPDPSRSDVARAFRLAEALLPEGMRRRVVLLSDGRENSGDAAAEAARLKRAGVHVDTVLLRSAGGADAAVAEVRAPSRARVGDEFTVEATIVTNTPGQAQVTLRRNGAVADERVVNLVSGENTLTFPQRADEPGPISFRIDVKTTADSRPQNDSGGAVTLVSGSPKVIVVEGSPDEGAAVAQALSERGFLIDRRPVEAFPGAEEMASAESIVLVDIDAPALSASDVLGLQAFVKDLGRGLVAIGGESSWSLGSYENSPLEALLPLDSEIKDPRRRPAVAQVLAIDTSGSMATCHCAGPGVQNDRMGGSGPNKTDISKAAAARAIDALEGRDEIGVLAFNTSSKWVIPLQELPSDEVVRNGLQRLTPTGGTAIPQALHASIEDLKKSKASLKHIILFTDGWSNAGELVPAAMAVREAGMTLSVIATGEGTGTELARMAEEGGGRFYAGRNLDEVPEIFMNEVVLATRRYINEGEFYPRVTGASAATDGLAESPPLLGYIGTSAKPSASVLLSLGEFDDPLLATWRTGLGVATAWTSDAKARWSTHWVNWEGFADFWSSVVRETLPASPAPGFSSRLTATEEGVEVELDSEQPIPEGAKAVATFIAPDGTSSTSELQRSGISQFSGTIGTGASGAYLGSVELSVGDQVIYRDAVAAVRSYSSEYRPGTANEALMKQLASATGGRYGIRPAMAFDKNLPLGFRRIEVQGWLLLLAALLLPIDIALRRLVITKEEVAAVRRWRPIGRAKPDRGPESDRLQRLTKAKYRVRQVQSPPDGVSAPGPDLGSLPAPETARPQPEPPRPPSPETSKPATPPAPGSSVSELVRRRREKPPETTG